MKDKDHKLKIRKFIEDLSRIADTLPGVLIVHDLRDWSVVWMSENGLKQLGVRDTDVVGKNSDEYHQLYFNEEDAKDYVPKIDALLKRNNFDETLSFFQQVRFHNKADWTWHMSSVKISLRDDEGTPLLATTSSMAIDTMHPMTKKASRLLDENNFLRKNFHLFAKLTKREIEVLRMMAMGKSASETAAELFIASNTVETHRKNIRQKLNSSSLYELSQYARAFDLI